MMHIALTNISPLILSRLPGISLTGRRTSTIVELVGKVQLV